MLSWQNIVLLSSRVHHNLQATTRFAPEPQCGSSIPEPLSISWIRITTTEQQVYRPLWYVRDAETAAAAGNSRQKGDLGDVLQWAELVRVQWNIVSLDEPFGHHLHLCRVPHLPTNIHTRSLFIYTSIPTNAWWEVMSMPASVVI